MLKQEKKRYIYYFITFAISFVVRIIQVAGEYQMRLIPDEIGMLASPAYLAGYDWSNVVGYTSYYGVAYYMWFAPVLKFISNPRDVYFVIIMVNLVLQSLTCVLSYHIAVCYFKFSSSLLTSLIAVVCSFVVATSSEMSQEPMLYFLTWLLVLVLLKMVAAAKSKISPYLYSVILALICAYAYLVHSRAIVFVVALFVAFLVSVYHDRKQIKSFLCFIVSVIVTIFLAGVIQKEIIAFLWKTADGKLNNVNIEVDSNAIVTMLTPQGIRVMLDMFVSNLLTAAGRTFGINILAIVMGCMLVAGTKIKKIAVSIELNKKIIFVFSLACYLIGVLGICVVWGKNVVPVYFLGEVNYSYKGFTYFRYAATFLGPAALAALGECLYNADLRVKMKLPVIISELFVVWYFFFFIIEKIRNSEFVNRAVVDYFKEEKDGFDILNYRVTVLLFVIFTFLFFVEWRKDNVKRVILMLCILCGLLPYARKGSGFIPRPQLNELGNGGYNLIRYLEGVNAMPDAIYCSSDVRAYRYQFHLKEYSIVVGYPSGGKHEIMFSPSEKRDENIPEYFEVLQLDNNEWVWTDDKNLYEIISGYVNQKE